MKTVNSEWIDGDLGEIFRLAARVEDWPEILPHYRSVRVLREFGPDRDVFMHCGRRLGPVVWPCRWTARQTVIEDAERIRFRHLTGPAKGMEVEWRFHRSEGGVLAEIHHELDHPLGRIYSDQLVGKLFVESIAGQTLRTIRTLVEARK